MISDNEVIKRIKNELMDSDRPIAKAIHKTDCGSAICIGFNSGMSLKEHMTRKPTTLLVLYGSVTYSENGKILELNQFDQHEIPVSVLHAVHVQEDSMILLIQG